MFATLPYKYVPFILPFRGKKTVYVQVYNSYELKYNAVCLFHCTPSSDVQASPLHQGHSARTSLSPCAKAPRSCDAGRVTASCAVTVDGRISCPLAPHRCAVSYSLMLPLKVQRPTLNFQWISMWTCEDTRRESGSKSLNKRLFLIRVTGSVNQQPLGERQKYRLGRTLEAI